MDDKAKFAQDYIKNRRRIYHAIGRYISDVCTVEDLTQHTFMKAWVHRETFKGDSSYSTWLHRIAINTALNYLTMQKHKPQKPYNDYTNNVELYSNSKSSLDTVIEDESLDNVYKAIELLPKDMKATIVLYIIYGHSYEDIAQTLNIPIGTVRSRIHRARYILKDLLS